MRIAVGQFDDTGTALANEGETISLSDAGGGVIQSFTYDDAWYPETDGDGYSLVPINTNGDYNSAANWRASAALGGSPGEVDPDPTPGDFTGDGTVDRRDVVRLLAGYGVSSGAIRGTGDANGDGAANLIDLALLARSISTPAPSPAASAVAAAETSTGDRGVRRLVARRVSHVVDRAIEQIGPIDRGEINSGSIRRRLARRVRALWIADDLFDAK
jgi:hypothetical protein